MVILSFLGLNLGYELLLFLFLFFVGFVGCLLFSYVWGLFGG